MAALGNCFFFFLADQCGSDETIYTSAAGIGAQVRIVFKHNGINFSIIVINSTFMLLFIYCLSNSLDRLPLGLALKF